ncbi:MAG: hypothetical protein OSB51_07220 [Dokdonia donghaensis]|nr:hypothetical protein [uncultured bacterium]MDE0598953.1 hypothetical protein [Dokdonia donghaensis]
MKTKQCHTCNTETEVAFRVRLHSKKQWVFICEDCCNLHKDSPGYTYGGTWKGKRH